MTSLKDIEDYYNSRSGNAQKLLLRHNSRIRSIKRFIRKNVKGKGYNTALDIGCGTGITSETLDRYVGSVVAIDLAGEIINLAKAYHGKFNRSNVLYIVGDFTINHLGKFDLVCAFDVIEHIQECDRAAFITNMHNHCIWKALVSVPIPGRTAYYRKHKPDVLQIIDEEIYDYHFSEWTIVSKKITKHYIYYVLRP